MSKLIEEYLEIIPKEYRDRLIILEPFRGNRTSCKFSFSCGCETFQSLKAIMKLKDFQYCFYCKHIYCDKYTCTYCQTEFIQVKMYEQCLSKCATKYQNLIENIDFVICQMCGFHAKSLGVHVNQRHNLTSEAYKKQFPNAQVIADNSHTNYSVVNTENGNWIQRAIENNEDLTEYWAKVSSGVTKSILDNPEERVRRAIVMSKVNQSDIMRQKASETAIKTSARPEILSQRTANLKKWRDENPEDFHNQCIKKMIGSFQSKPEKKLFELVSSLDGFVFKRNQFINSLLVSNKSHNKQMDMGDKAKRIYIEFDGILHFEPRRGIQILEQSKARDREIEQHIINHNWTLIRVSYDQFKYSTKMVGKIKTDASYFKQECLDKLVSILHDGKPGIYKIGEAYE